MRNTSSPLGSVDKALQLIVLLRSGHPLSVKETAEALDVAPSTAHRLLSALAHRDFASQGSDRRYRPGPATGRPGPEPVTLRELREAALEPLRTLNSRVHETVQLMILRERNIQFVDGVEAAAALRVAMRMGDQMPAYTSAGGKAMLAELSPAELDALYHGGLPPWPTSSITTPAQLRRQLAETRRAGFGRNFEETEQGVVGLGVSVHGEAGRPIGAITIALPRARWREDSLGRFVSALREAALATEDRVRAQKSGTSAS